MPPLFRNLQHGVGAVTPMSVLSALSASLFRVFDVPIPLRTVKNCYDTISELQ